jgi:signal transduction histidine kinase
LVFQLEKGIHKPVSPRRLKATEILPGNMADLEALSTRIWILTPLVFQDQTIGHLLLPGRHPDTEIYETLTKQIASSIQGARLLEQIKTHEQSLEQEVQRRTQQLTQVNQDLRQEVATRIRLEQEVIDISKHTMERIGQDLHDDLCQHLAGVTMHVSALGRRIAPTAPEALPVVDSINGLLSDSIERAKALVRGLLPPGLREEGITRALENLCNEMARSSGILVDFNATGPADGLEVERGIELYRIIQEALNNAVKHSGASRITVELEGQLQEPADLSQGVDPCLYLTARIRDNGKGFVPRPRGKGMGLKIMRYRGEKADIQVHIEHHKPGTEVLCSLVQNPIQGEA